MSTVQPKRKRNARPTGYVLAALEERLLIAVPADSPHLQRVMELTDELRRSLGSAAAQEAGE